MNVDAVYGADYQASGLDHFRRFAWLYEQALLAQLIRPHEPEMIELARFRGLHSDSYLDAMASGRTSLATTSYLPWSPGLLRTCLSMSGGQLTAARLALSRGLAVNLACGFHHAHPEYGGGYCVFNGLALVAAEHPSLRVSVLDCDEHGGDGTEAFCHLLPNLSAISIFGTRFGLRGGGRSVALQVPREDELPRDEGFLQSLDQALDALLHTRPDLVIYQASADSHVDDPKATLKLSSDTLAVRDRRVLRAMQWAGIPVLITLAGGYQADEAVGQLYLSTLRIAASLSNSC
jgi:acetoin utilization deacetylase AcuC-like enzyme